MARPPIKDKNKTPGLVNLGPLPSQAPVASFNLDQIENLIQTKGFVCLHYRHALNPDKEDVHGPTNVNSQAAHRGYRYYKPKYLRQVPQSFKLEDRLTVYGVWSVGTVLMNVSGRYVDDDLSEIVHIRERDLLVFPTLTTATQQLFEYNPTGPQKLHYKCKGVDYLADNEREYVQDRDYKINENGELEWLSGLRPDFNNGKGAVLTCVYFITPIYIVQNLLHSLRVIPDNEMGHGGIPRNAAYAPQLIVCKPSTIAEENEILDFNELPPFPEYPGSGNTTGGSV